MADRALESPMLTADEVSRMRERRLLVAAFRRSTPRAPKGEIEAQAFRVQTLAYFASLVTPPDEAQSQVERLLRAADDFHRACLAVSPDVLGAIDAAGRLRIVQAQAIAASAIGAIDEYAARGGDVESAKSRAAVVSDAVLVAYAELAGEEASNRSPPGGGPVGGPALYLLKEVFKHFGLDDSPEVQLQDAIARRELKRAAPAA
ncbi:MAG TPA: hypothetical protein VIJ59_05450 [Caulobacteraceae bacterium]